MLIKKKAIFRGEIFTRVYWEFNNDTTNTVCDDCGCKYNRNNSGSTTCRICDDVYGITGLYDNDINYGWIIKEKDRKD